jgi:hypothetical protein
MARKELSGYEAVSAAVPGEEGYDAAIAVKGLGVGGAPVFHRILPGLKFKTALAADAAASEELARLLDIDAQGNLSFSGR